MPLTQDVGGNMIELLRDNKKKGKARGAGGQPRSRAQMIAISLNAAREHGAHIPKPKK